MELQFNANPDARGDRRRDCAYLHLRDAALGGQLAVGVTGIVGNLDTSIAGTLTARLGPSSQHAMGSCRIRSPASVISIRW